MLIINDLWKCFYFRGSRRNHIRYLRPPTRDFRTCTCPHIDRNTGSRRM